MIALLPLLISAIHASIGPHGFVFWIQPPHISAGIGWLWGGHGWDNGPVTWWEVQ